MIEGPNQYKSTVHRRVLAYTEARTTIPGIPVAGYQWSNTDNDLSLL
jgi:hypothetical protein